MLSRIGLLASIGVALTVAGPSPAATTPGAPVRQPGAPAARATAAPATPVAPAARPAGPPDGRAILEKVNRTYRGLTSFQFEGIVHVEMRRQDSLQTAEFPIVAAAAKPGRSRTEIRNPAMGLAMVADGKSTTTFVQQLNQYARKPTPRRTAAADSAEAMAGPGSPVMRYFHITRDLIGARWLRTQALPLGDRPAECDVIQADYKHPTEVKVTYSPSTFWIDRARAVVLRESTHVAMADPEKGGTVTLAQTTTFHLARVNEKLPDSLWVFRAPEGAQEVTNLGRNQGPDLSGKKAEDFTLTDLAGKPVKLSSLRGKVVLLDFWATWCGPCRIEMPDIQKLHAQFKSKGLVVLGINLGEEATAVRPFLKKNGYDFRILLDRQKAVGERYQVSGIPTLFIIDRTGTIRTHFVGVRDEGTLREALAEAGIK